MMYRCNDCGRLFEEPYVYEEPDVGYAALWCPSCHSDDLSEVEECKLCGALELTHELTVDGYCRACVEKARASFNKVLKTLFEAEELKILKSEFEIEPIE